MIVRASLRDVTQLILKRASTSTGTRRQTALLVGHDARQPVCVVANPRCDGGSGRLDRPLLVSIQMRAQIVQCAFA